MHLAVSDPTCQSFSQLPGVFVLLPWMRCYYIVGLRIKFAGTHLHIWVERGTVRVKCLAQEHNTMSLARARTQATQSRVKHANHETTAPPLQPTIGNDSLTSENLNDIHWYQYTEQSVSVH